MAATSKPSKSKASGATKKTSEKTSEKKNASSSEKGSKSKATTRSSGTSKSSSSRSGSSSATGASKTAGKSERAGSKSSTVKAAASSRKKETPKSGSAGKRTASGGAKKSTKTPSATSKSRPGAGSKSAASAKRSSTTNSRGSKSAKSTKEKGIVGRITEAVGSLLSGGKRDVLDLLKEDHRRVDGYFQKVKAAEDANHEPVFRKIKGELDLHAHVEEAIFYPHLMQTGTEKLKKIVREGVEEHAQVKTLLVELSELKGTDKVFKAKLKVLMENVEHHVKEEEDEMFPIVEDELSEETLVKLAEQIEKEKAKVARTKPRSRAASAMKS